MDQQKSFMDFPANLSSLRQRIEDDRPEIKCYSALPNLLFKIYVHIDSSLAEYTKTRRDEKAVSEQGTKTSARHPTSIVSREDFGASLKTFRFFFIASLSS
jgi:hypothetical protein